MSSAIVSYAPWLAWAFVPSFATKIALDLLYSSRLVARPQNREQAMKHGARVRVLLVCGFLAYQFFNFLAAQEPTAYSLLNVDLDANVEAIKKAFRRLAMVHHPDKVGAQGERFFIALRRSHDVLSDPVKRFAYDRFGIGVLGWKDAVSYREHMVVGLRDTLLFYLINPIIFTFISWIQGDKSPFAFWHMALLFSLAGTEVYLIAAVDRPEVMRHWLPNHTVHEIVLCLHQIYTSATMAMRQLLPLLPVFDEPDLTGPKSAQEAERFLDALASELDKLNANAHRMKQGSDCALMQDLLPLRARPKEGPATLQDTLQSARRVAPAETNSASHSRSEDAYIDLVSQHLIRTSLRDSPDVWRFAAGLRRRPVGPSSTGESKAPEVFIAPQAQAERTESPQLAHTPTAVN